jgi:AcrR family transcriptional regulator
MRMAKNRVAGAFDRSGRTRAALLDAARRVFADAGYLKAEIAQITRAADRATGTFYVHFDNKLELLKAMVEQFQLDLLDSGLNRPEHPPEAAPQVLRALWRTHHRHAATFRALVEAATVHPEMATLYENMRHHARHDFHSMLAGAPRLADADRGELTVMAAAIENMVCACLYEWHALGKRPEGYTEERGFQSVLDIMLRVIGCAGSASAADR